jgi:hypothetical protein
LDIGDFDILEYLTLSELYQMTLNVEVVLYTHTYVYTYIRLVFSVVDFVLIFAFFL